MKYLFFGVALITCILVISGAAFFSSRDKTAPEPQPMMLDKNWTPKQAWDLLTNIDVTNSMTIPYKGRTYECVIFGDQDLNYGNPKAIIQICFDRVTLKILVKNNTFSPKDPES